MTIETRLKQVLGDVYHEIPDPLIASLELKLLQGRVVVLVVEPNAVYYRAATGDLSKLKQSKPVRWHK